MFSIFQRGQHVLNFSLTIVGFLAVFIAASSWYQLYTTDAFSAPSTINNVIPSTTVKFSRRFGGSVSKGKENSKVTFDLDADLTPLFNWNTKQVFVYLSAEYPGKKEGYGNKVTYWDKIIKSKDEANLTLSNENTKYSVWDIEDSFSSKQAELKLEWNIQPWVGPLIYGSTVGEYSFEFPKPESESESQEKRKKKRKQQNA